MTGESALTFECGEDTLVAVVHVPEPGCKTGVLIVVGGPQYRVGSHRQFVLLARHLAKQGIPVFRFDHRGIGDSDGSSRSFTEISEDIRCAIDTFMSIHTELHEVYIWGLCDAASASLLYACQDARVAGLVLLNPWVRTEAGLAKAYLTSYYIKLAMSSQFWKDVLTGRTNIYKSLLSLCANVRVALAPATSLEAKSEKPTKKYKNGDAANETGVPFPVRMLAGLKKFGGRTLIVLSGEDITAAEFRNLVRSERAWRKTVRRESVTWVEVPESNHTFSSRVLRNQVAEITATWVLEK